MLVTSLGKNIYPTPVENNYLQSPKIEQIFIIADKREYVTALVVPNQEEYKQKFGVGDDFFTQEERFIDDPAVQAWLEEDIKRLGEALAKYARIRAFRVKRHMFTQESGELTITLKTKRKVVTQNYEKEIEAMYAAD
jgi:long-chain acyl-CoA synthetase